MSISGIGGALALPNMFSGSAAGSAERLQKSPEEEFLEYARQSPAERIRAAILEEMGISEDELEAMSGSARGCREGDRGRHRGQTAGGRPAAPRKHRECDRLNTVCILCRGADVKSRNC